jgi:hypothetical protein
LGISGDNTQRIAFKTEPFLFRISEPVRFACDGAKTL